MIRITSSKYVFRMFAAFGWLQRTLEGPERSEAYSVFVGYSKGAGPNVGVLVELAPGSETSECFLLVHRRIPHGMLAYYPAYFMYTIR